MSTPTTLTRYTPEDLLRMPDGDLFELVDGQLVERNMSTLASFVGGGIYLLLGKHCENPQAGWPFPEGTSYQCFPHEPNRVRRADVSVFRWHRRSIGDFRDESRCPLAPDLAVEVVSPNDEVYEVDAKVQEWLSAGVNLVWVVNPSQQTVEIHRPTGAGTILHESDEQACEDVLPGFRCRVADFFTAPGGQQPVAG